MSQVQHRTVETNGIRMHVAEQGEGPLVVLCHGFPESWYSWRHQLAALAAAGYRAVAPDMRGYGQTDAPRRSPTTRCCTWWATWSAWCLRWARRGRWWSATTGARQWLGIAPCCVPICSPACCTQRAVSRPRASACRPPRCRAPTTASSTSCIFRSRARPSANWRATCATRCGRGVSALGRCAAPRLAADHHGAAPRRLSRRAWPIPRELPAWLREADLDFYVAEFERTGFRGGLNWYRNIDRNWELLAPTQAPRSPCRRCSWPATATR